MPEPSGAPSCADESLAIVLLARDLLISSRVTTAAKRLGTPVRLLRDPAALLPHMPARLLIIDLDLEGALQAAIAWSQAQGKPAAGFVQHVHGDRIREAKAAGVSPVIPRSRLEAVLPELLGTG